MTPNDNAQKVGVLAVMATAISHVVIDSHGMQSEYQDECATEALRSKLIEARATVKALAEAAKGLRFDLYELTTPELRAAFDGKPRIAVVQGDTIPALRDALKGVGEPC